MAYQYSSHTSRGLPGPTGKRGMGISNIVKTGTIGLVDTYRILYTDGTYFDYSVTNGASGGGDALTSFPLSQFAPTTSFELKNVISDETGSGALVFANSPALITPTGIVKNDVGLGNVDNTSDANKPISTATQTALNAKQDTLTGLTASVTELNYTDGVTSAIQTQLGAKASTALDNLGTVAINTSLVSDTDNTDDLGTTLKKWANLFVTTIGATATRVTKGWFTDLEVTNAIAGSITGNAATVTVANEASDTTCYPLFATAASGSLPAKSNTNLYFNSSTGILGASYVTTNEIVKTGGTGNLVMNTTPIQVSSIEVGHGTDTSVTRIAAGLLGIEGEVINGYATTATGAGTTTLSITSPRIQFFTGATTKTVKLPTTGVVLGQQYIVYNNCTSNAGVLTIQSSGANDIIKMSYGVYAVFTALQATPTTAAHWAVSRYGAKNIITATSYTTDTGTSLNCDYYDEFIVTAQAGALKLNNPTGTPKDGQILLVAVTGTAARALTYDTQFEASTVSLPSTTVTTARLNMIFIWRADTSKWVILGAV